MEKSQVHVLVSRDWFDEMFIKGNAKQNKIATYEAFEAYAASVGIVIKFTSSLSLDDGFVFVHPRWFTNADKEEYAEKFAYIVDRENEFIVQNNHLYVDAYRMQAITIRTPFVVNQSKESIVYLESVYRKIITNNPDVSNRYRDNHAVFSYMLTNQHEAYMKELMQKKSMNVSTEKMFVDASDKVRDMMEKFSHTKKKLTNPAMGSGWRSDMDNDKTHGYLNIEHAARNANRANDEEWE
jgi:hypothetical protein